MRRSGFQILILLPMLFLLTACPNPPPAEESCNFVQNDLGRRVSWARLPIQMYAHKSIRDDDENLYYGIIEAMEVWNQHFEEQGLGPVFEFLGRASEGLPDISLTPEGKVVSDGFNGVYIVDKTVFENTASTDEQARTSISFRGDYIFEADILIDASETFYFSDTQLDPSSRSVQFKSLMIHELGHVLGLGHVEIDGVLSVMNPKLQFGQLRIELEDIDRESVNCEYQF